jgi:hypothetical protein
MQITLIITLVLHVLSGVFWAGSTFALARAGGNQGTQLFRPQMGAATIAVVTGAVLWFLLHRGGTGGTQEHLLGIGAICALIAAGVQGVTSGPAVRRLAVAGELEAAASLSRAATGQRIAAGLLAITVICMAAARYA